MTEEHNAADPTPSGEIACDGVYPKHLQGIATGDGPEIFWCFTVVLVKTDLAGRVLARVEVPNHHGDLECHDGKVFVAVNLGAFNREPGHADSWVYVYDAGDLSFLAKHPCPEAVHGAGAIARGKDGFLVGGGLPVGRTVNYVYEYDERFRFRREVVIESGYTRLGVQTALHAQGAWWFGCYGDDLLKTDASFRLTGKFGFDCALGLAESGGDGFLVGRGFESYRGKALPARADETKGLVV